MSEKPEKRATAVLIVAQIAWRCSKGAFLGFYKGHGPICMYVYIYLCTFGHVFRERERERERERRVSVNCCRVYKVLLLVSACIKN